MMPMTGDFAGPEVAANIAALKVTANTGITTKNLMNTGPSILLVRTLHQEKLS
jgi:hypothetical protein